MRRGDPVIAAILSLAAIFAVSPTRAQEKALPAHPDKELWSLLKKALTSEDGQEYFDKNLKGAQLPPLEGRVVSATPADYPRVLVLKMYDGDHPEVTLRFKDDKGGESHEPGPMVAGSSIRFEGVGVSLSEEPFMLTFDVLTGPPARSQQ